MNGLWKSISSNEKELQKLVETYLSFYSFINSDLSSFIIENVEKHLQGRMGRIEPPYPSFEVKVDRNTVIKKFVADLVNFSKESQFRKPKLSCFEVRALAGQRFTPASIRGCKVKIPTRDSLISLSRAKHKETALSVAARALAKHQARSSFWGKTKGGIEERNQQAEHWIQMILQNKTWWNMYGHYRHEYIYEARIKSGHGARWNPTNFVGFVEPFYGENDQNLSVK